MTYENTQPRPGHLHSVSVNPGDRGGSDDGMDGGLAGSGKHQTSDSYPHTISANGMGGGGDTTPEGQTLRGYVYDQPDASVSLKNTSSGRVRNL